MDLTSIDGFYIYHKPYGSKEEFKMQTLEGSGIRNHLLTDLKPDTEYSIKMKCFNDAGASDYSNMVVKRTRRKSRSLLGEVGPLTRYSAVATWRSDVFCTSLILFWVKLGL